MNSNDFEEGIILKTDYERNTKGVLQLLIIKSYTNNFGVSNMFFRGDEKINELFDDYMKIHYAKITPSINDMVHKEVWMPKTLHNTVPEGVSFNYPLSDNFKGFVENNNGE